MLGVDLSEPSIDLSILSASAAPSGPDSFNAGVSVPSLHDLMFESIAQWPMASTGASAPGDDSGAYASIAGASDSDAGVSFWSPTAEFGLTERMLP
jgi:hypothetical protein